MTFFFTMIAGRRRQVVIKDQNMGHTNFDDFTLLCTDTYLVPIERLNGIRPEKTGFVATSILPRHTKAKPVSYIVVEEEPVVEAKPEPLIVIDKPCFEFSLPKTRRKERKVVKRTEVSRDKIKQLRGTLTPIYTNIDPRYGEHIYQQDKQKWIDLYGNDDLKFAQSCGSSCDCGYVLQRAAIDFPGFEVCGECRIGQIDTPDIGIMKFIMHEALTLEQLASIKRYKSKIAVHEKENDPTDLLVVVQNYLFHCDLSISLRDLVDSTRIGEDEDAS